MFIVRNKDTGKRSRWRLFGVFTAFEHIPHLKVGLSPSKKVVLFASMKVF